MRLNGTPVGPDTNNDMRDADADGPERSNRTQADLPAVLTPKEAADHLRVSVWAIYDAVKAGTLPSTRIGRSIRIPTRAVVGDLLDRSPTGGA